MRRFAAIFSILYSVFLSPVFALQGGEPIGAGSADFLKSSVRFIGMGDGLCTGVRIARFAFLTAAHCAKNLEPKTVIQVEPAGTLMLTDALVTAIYIHPGYSMEVEYSETFLNQSVDLAVVMVENFDSPFAKTAIPEATVAPEGAPGAAMFITGGGCERLADGACEIPASPGAPLNFLQTEISDPSLFNFLVGSLYFSTASGPLMRLLHGDSGGGAFDAAGNLVGIHSQIRIAATANVPGNQYHTRLAPHLEWISSKMNDDNVLVGRWVRETSTNGSHSRDVLEFLEGGRISRHTYVTIPNMDPIEMHFTGSYERGIAHGASEYSDWVTLSYDLNVPHTPEMDGRYAWDRESGEIRLLDFNKE